MKNYVAYYRVSTAKQGASGLGLDSQRSTVTSFVGIQGVIVAEFTDIESGKKDDRPELAKALQMCKDMNAALVIAKLDRLSRNVRFIVELQESKVSFVCCDMPEANEFTIHIFAAMSQHERKLISARTKDGLASKKARIAAGNYLNSKSDDTGTPTAMKPDKNGVYRLGNPNGWTEEQRALAAARKREKAMANANTKKAVKRVLECLKHKPDASLSELAAALNEYDIKTPTGKPFTRSNVPYIKQLAQARQELETEPVK
ncbi:hypothetical protein OB13_10560 [Pontibacter sp. HJ8]